MRNENPKSRPHKVQLGAEMASPWRIAAGAKPSHTHATGDDLTLLQLREMLLQERARSVQLEGDVAEAHRLMSALRMELADSQSGEKHSRHLALHDSLTTLPNRAYFLQRLSDMLAQPLTHAVAVLFLDLDGFKAINDVHGHAAGDELLSIVAVRLMRTIRSEDMVCRLGGDEFACMVCPVPGRAQLARMADKVFAAVSDPVRMGDLLVRVQPSIGIAVCDAPGTTAELLLSRADAAMFAAKRAHSRVVFYDPAHTPLITEGARS